MIQRGLFCAAAAVMVCAIGAAVLQLLQTDAAGLGLAYLLTGAGIKQIP